MGAYALDILPLIKFLLQFINLNEMNAKEAVFADDFLLLAVWIALRITEMN